MDARKTNLMSDRRVVRGNTYSARPIMQNFEETAPVTQQLRKTRTKSRSRKIQEPEQDQKAPHEYLEELTDIPIAEDFSTQTNEAESEESKILFVPKPKGEDKGTAIEEMEMFDFESSVEPLLEVLIGKSMEQGLLEVRQEEELKVLKAQRVKWENQRNLIHNEAQRLLAEALRKKEETDRRLAQAKEAEINAQIEAHNLAARTTARDFFGDLQETVLKRLVQAGHFYDPVRNQVENTFMPWLVEQVAQNVGVVQQARDELDHIMQTSISKLDQRIQEAERLRKELREQKEREEEEERRRKEEEAKKMAEEEARRKAEAAAAEAEDEDE